ncbi:MULTISPECIES: siderophore-interacting protein [unclassified Crossiella]|uniref:siderophore-interacting protein n=1 Tax=unclassified Crossiella TaxID=2620835 RepID=UPI0020001436|nr:MULTISPECIES: siderophore-interacting protein [unclassified Crossiella]MCK2239185.1 siderophore-interacting protein [Crossiella sp. S99.2]MCK2251246.1 siderophore-interacting protein [Crossiella sp. S99.1]
MSKLSRFDRLQLNLLSSATSLVMAAPTAREDLDQFLMTVTAVRQVAPKVRRITFHATEFEFFARSGPDEYFGLLMPQAGQQGVLLPAERMNVRAAIRRMPAAVRPELRWYTIRELRAADGEIDVDFVLHADAGPGSAWAATAKPGYLVGFRTGGSCYQPPASARHQLLAADDTALPALAAILSTVDDEAVAGLRVLVEVPGAEYRVPLDERVAVTWLTRDGEPGAELVRTLRASDLPELDYAWVCGESGLATGVRRHLVKERGLDRRRVLFSGYWKVGAART